MYFVSVFKFLYLYLTVVRQRAAFYDLNTTVNESRYLGGMHAIVSTWSSTYIVGKDMSHDVTMMKVIFLYYI